MSKLVIYHGSKDIIEKEIHRFYYEMNKYLNKVKENR